MLAEEHCSILIAGAGPAGIAAACAAAGSGASVVLLDDNPALGGQIWRGEEKTPGGSKRDWMVRLSRSGARVYTATRAIAPIGPGLLLAERDCEPLLIHYGKLILATGARELFLPFPGWTLPGVTGAGGLQALVHGGFPIAGKRVVLAGSGPLLLAIASHLRACGALVGAVAEQAPFSRLARFAATLAGSPRKLAQAARLQWSLRGVPILTRAWPIAAEGGSTVSSVLLRSPQGTQRFVCDYLACGFGLVPNVELAALAGCEIRDGFVKVDEWQRTSIANIFCGGEPTGIGGLERSLVEGQVAGHAAAGATARAYSLFRKRRALDRFSEHLAACFALDEELRSMPREDTMVCRCEDVCFGATARRSDGRDAKLQTRCGMGPCQGRVCGPSLQFLRGWPWPQSNARPPLYPASMATLSALATASGVTSRDS